LRSSPLREDTAGSLEQISLEGRNKRNKSGKETEEERKRNVLWTDGREDYV
jgi:hypothetical protein